IGHGKGLGGRDREVVPVFVRRDPGRRPERDREDRRGTLRRHDSRLLFDPRADAEGETDSPILDGAPARPPMTWTPFSPLLLGVVGSACAGGPGRGEDGGFVPLFDGRSLSGWVVVNGGPSTWTVRDGMIVCSGRPAGMLRTERAFENFVLDLDWR